MKYIKVTQENKENNKKLFRGYNVGSIYTKGLPDSFKGVINQDGNYKNSPNHEADGWIEFVEIVVDEFTHKKSAVFFDSLNKVFTQSEIKLTPEEQENYIKRFEDKDSASLNFQKHKLDGIIAFDRAYSLIDRVRLSENITDNQAELLRKNLYPVLEPLYKGLWKLAKNNLDASTPPANVKLLGIITKIKDYIDNYIANNY